MQGRTGQRACFTLSDLRPIQGFDVSPLYFVLVQLTPCYLCDTPERIRLLYPDLKQLIVLRKIH